MKKLLFLLAVSGALLSGCGRNPKPDDVVYKTITFQAGFKPGPTVKDNPVPVMVTKVELRPTWGQSNYFANKRGDWLIWQILAVVLLLVAAWLIIGFYSLLPGKLFNDWFPNMNALAWGGFMFVALAGALASWKWQAASIKWNNDIKIEKTHLDQTIEAAGSSRPIWDSLEAGCHINWGPYKCFDK